MITGRKARTLLRNFGGQAEAEVRPTFQGATPVAESRASVVFPARIYRDLLAYEVARIAADEEEASRFLGHMFDPVIGAQERLAFAADLRARPPAVVLGYPRVDGEFPCYSVVLDGEEESDAVLGDYVGETTEGERGPAAEFVGVHFKHTHGVYVYAQHPDQCLYLYEIAKMVLFGGKQSLVASGLVEPEFSGGELSPEEVYLPELMYARVLRVTAKSLFSVPRLVQADPASMRLVGLYRDDVFVDGIRGGVGTYVAERDGEDDG